MRSTILFALLLTCACGGDVEQPCATASECPFGQVCVNGACTVSRGDAGEDARLIDDASRDSGEARPDVGADASSDARVDGSSDAAIDARDASVDARGCSADTDCAGQAGLFCVEGRCVECETASDCRPVESASGECAFARECGESGSQLWTVTTQSCSAGSCVAVSEAEETRTCTRDTAGMSCTSRCLVGSGLGCACVSEICRTNRRITMGSSGSDPSLRHSVTCVATGETCFREGTGIIRECVLTCPEGSALSGCCSSGSAGCGGTEAASMNPSISYSFPGLCSDSGDTVTCGGTVAEDVALTCTSNPR